MQTFQNTVLTTVEFESLVYNKKTRSFEKISDPPNLRFFSSAWQFFNLIYRLHYTIQYKIWYLKMIIVASKREGFKKIVEFSTREGGVSDR